MRYLLLMLVIVIAGCSTGGDPIMPPEPEDIMTYRWPVTYGVTSTARVNGADYNIIGVDTVLETFTVAGDQTLIFTPGVTFEVNGSTGNDGDWVVMIAFFDLVNTVITVTGNITNAVADGVITPYTIPAADELRIAFWDDVGGVFVQATICTDSLQNQWVNQRCGIGSKANGQWGVADISINNVLRYWQNATAGWIASGAWNLLDDDSAELWTAVDVETRQNYIWAGLFVGGNLFPFSIDLSAGVPNWITGLLFTPVDDTHYSVVLDRNLLGALHWAYRVAGDIDYYASTPEGGGVGIGQIVALRDYPQIIIDAEQRLWCFHTGSNILRLHYNFALPPITPTWQTPITPIYTATALTADHKEAHNPVDDTNHIILVDNIVNANELIYLRRTANGWSAPITLQTGGAFEIFSSPQITCDSMNRINIYYIHDGDLVNLLLPSADYADFATPANWDKTVNVDGTGDTIKHCNAISNMPEDI